MYDLKAVLRAASVEEALKLLRENPGAIPVAGGTDVLLHVKHGKLPQAVLVTIQDIPELCGVRLEKSGDIVIGPGTCFARLERDPILLRCAPMLAHACRQVGSPQIREMATIGGNICNGAVSADSVPSLLALDAQLELTSSDGTVTRPLEGFHTGPGRTSLEPGTLLTAIRIPRSAWEGCGGCYLKFGQRQAMEISTLGVAARVRLDEEGRAAEIALAYGVAAPVPVRCRKTEALLTGRVLDDGFLHDLREHVLEELNPRDSWRASKELRVQLIREQGCRAVRQAAAEAGGKNQ